MTMKVQTAGEKVRDEGEGEAGSGEDKSRRGARNKGAEEEMIF